MCTPEYLLGTEASIPKPFKFEGFWTRNESCSAVVATARARHFSGTPGKIMFDKLRAVRGAIKKWNRPTYGNIHVSIKEQIGIFQNAEPSIENLGRESMLMIELD